MFDLPFWRRLLAELARRVSSLEQQGGAVVDYVTALQRLEARFENLLSRIHEFAGGVEALERRVERILRTLDEVQKDLGKGEKP